MNLDEDVNEAANGAMIVTVGRVERILGEVEVRGRDWTKKKWKKVEEE